jgi:hypothetical protein
MAEFGRVRTREHRGIARAAREPVHCLGRIGGHGAVSRVGGQPRPAGREPSGRGAATRSARPPPQADSSGSNEPRCTRPPRERDGPSSSRQAFSRRDKDHRQGRAQGRVPATRGRPWTVILPGKTRQLSGGRANLDSLGPSLECQRDLDSVLACRAEAWLPLVASTKTSREDVSATARSEAARATSVPERAENRSQQRSATSRPSGADLGTSRPEPGAKRPSKQLVAFASGIYRAEPLSVGRTESSNDDAVSSVLSFFCERRDISCLATFEAVDPT